MRRVVVSTYHQWCGAGHGGLKNLSQTVLDGGTPKGEVLPYSLAFNLFFYNSPLQANSYCEEEMKMVNETRKIMVPDLLHRHLRASACCRPIPKR